MERIKSSGKGDGWIRKNQLWDFFDFFFGGRKKSKKDGQPEERKKSVACTGVSGPFESHSHAEEFDGTRERRGARANDLLPIERSESLVRQVVHVEL